MRIIAHEPSGFEGRLVHVEVDLRRGIPGVDLVGLAAGAVREAKERVRAAVRNSGYEFPRDRILINLAPADLPKEGSAYDLPLALAVLAASGSLPDPGFDVLALGELRLDGSVRPVRAVLPAIASGLAAGLGHFLVPEDNLGEARAIGRGSVHPISTLSEAAEIFARIRRGLPPDDPEVPNPASPGPGGAGDFSEIRGQAVLKRALEVAAAGGHHLLILGPPGSGKTMAARRFPTILPDLGEEDAIEVASLRSLAGLLRTGRGIERRPPFRSPHHSASLEGLIGGGRRLRPGEISLAHRGVLFLDEASEFRSDALQSLREPIEEGFVTLVRAGTALRFPAAFQLLLAANPCLCGNLGREGKACVCSIQELQRHRRKLGGALLDRIDIRVAVEPAGAPALLGPSSEASSAIRARVEDAIDRQTLRYHASSVDRNARLGPDLVDTHCRLDGPAARALERAVERLAFSSRACHSVLKTARTIADLDSKELIGEEHLLEAVHYRRYLDGEGVWPGS